jgi:hypothetical protein
MSSSPGFCLERRVPMNGCNIVQDTTRHTPLDSQKMRSRVLHKHRNAAERWEAGLLAPYAVLDAHPSLVVELGSNLQLWCPGEW